jgi:CheY-like chemotaxis protein
MEIVESRLSILVAEDDEIVRALFAVLLNRNGFRVECVADGSEALQRIDNGTYDLLVLDLMMPRVSGFEIIDYLAHTKPELLRRTIVVTGATESILRNLDPRSVFAVLRKPFDTDRLVDTVRHCAGQSRSPRHHIAPVDDVPALKTLLRHAPHTDGERLLLGELRRVVGELREALQEASRLDDVRTRSLAYARLARVAESLIRG